MELDYEILDMDTSWEKYMDYSGKDETPARYKYSIDMLYGDVLDIGSGDGYGLWWMKKNKNIKSVTCIEPQKKAIKQIKSNFKNTEIGLNLVIYNTTIEDFDIKREYDCVHCGHTIEHVANERFAMKKIVQLAKDKIVISVPIKGGISKEHLREFKGKMHVWKFMKKYFNVEGYKIFSKNNKVKSMVVYGKRN